MNSAEQLASARQRSLWRTNTRLQAEKRHEAHRTGYTKHALEQAWIDEHIAGQEVQHLEDLLLQNSPIDDAALSHLLYESLNDLLEDIDYASTPKRREELLERAQKAVMQARLFFTRDGV